ncbi:hypothetical protein [Thalassobacillus devorans]|uniref:hypothetical protein n=1 Tax=Thalassobacillus devorans TaxID=279813 RepID=UPI000491221E|nr:hypothetical protein [Thalassobacillus devorans]
MVGPILASWIREVTASYALMLSIFGGMFIAALLISPVIRMDIKQLKKEQKLSPAEQKLSS